MNRERQRPEIRVFNDLAINVEPDSFGQDKAILSDRLVSSFFDYRGFDDQTPGAVMIVHAHPV